MSVTVDFRVLELLCGRLCHELISPVGAINNGVELLDEDDPEFVKEAMTLIGQSARRAGQRLQFYRFAYGTAGGSGSAVDARELVQGLLEGGKVRCVWPAEASALEPPWQRLALNMLVLAFEMLPRGGTVTIKAAEHGVEVAAEGDAINYQRRSQSGAGGRGRGGGALGAHRSRFLYHAARRGDRGAARTRHARRDARGAERASCLINPDRARPTRKTGRG